MENKGGYAAEHVVEGVMKEVCCVEEACVRVEGGGGEMWAVWSCRTKLDPWMQAESAPNLSWQQATQPSVPIAERARGVSVGQATLPC